VTLLVPNVGEARMLKLILNNVSQEDVILKLYKNNVTPAEGDVASDYTVADFTGYASLTLTGASWSFTTGDPSYASYAQQSFTSTAGGQSQTIYGYFVVQASSGILLWAERFAGAPYAIVNNDDAIKVTPYIELA